ncbi:vanillate O-demethylase ferredoxin subunit [Pelomonas aquatica]|uniref:Vanillate O-demethylase ferredoxin subunit n=1 Tax=Pelomonas aquatica TaxID=431058 RepID=A0ABU1ZFJ7_9BURK|nr:PDR/VanB family oxidoreductase [Pelomonas aquatica]MDR7299409.1 vanillate O-demethylase ferredoxin subunit [Pelomonas aquatica]
MITVRIEAKTAIAQDVCALTLVPADGGALPAFTAGAHVDVHLPGGIVRQYSISNDPAETHRYVLGVLREAGSRGGSKAVHEQLAAGQTLQVSAPRNHFPLAPRARRSLLIAGGIGITPILAMARQLARDDADFELHYAASSAERMAFRAEIEASPWAAVARLHVGRQRLDVERLLAAQAADVHVYVCGPKRLIDAVTDASQRLGWPGERVHHEFFAGAEPPAPGGNDAFDIELRSGRVIRVAAEQTAAQALIAAGVPLLTSCEQGVCGTCLTRVLAGEPEHRDLYLTPQEQAANDQFTPCCSRSRGQRLVLDL